jgi:colicin import membrane protein
MTTSIAEYSATDSALAELRQKYETVVFDVTSGKGMEQAKKARAELRDYRVTLEKTRVEIKAPALERCRQIDSEAKRITAELEALEEPIDAQIKAEENRKAREKEERERQERARQEALQKWFADVRGLPLRAVGVTADAIRAVIAEAEATDTSGVPDDHQAAAKFEIRNAVAGLKAALDSRLAADEEAERIKAERAELERLRAEAAAVQAEKDRLAEAERARVAAEERRKEEQARAEREAIERAEREAREAEQRRIDAERAAQRKKEDAERAKAAEKLRQEQAALAAERKRLADEQAAAAKAARDAEIANATLLAAANEAVHLLVSEGYGDHLVTQKLAAAVAREPVAA